MKTELLHSQCDEAHTYVSSVYEVRKHTNSCHTIFDDEHRTQIRLLWSTVPVLEKVIEKVYEKLRQKFHGNVWEITEMNVLRSTGEGQRQRDHCDWHQDDWPLFKQKKNPQGVSQLKLLPVSVLIALEHDTMIVVKPKSFFCYQTVSKEETIAIPKGKMVIFRGDLVHAGYEFKKVNVRLHLYLDIPGYPRRLNGTCWIDEPTELQCKKCKRVYETRKKWRDHVNKSIYCKN